MKQIILTLAAIIFIATFSLAQNIPSYVPTNGLVGWWPFNGNANDESGNGNNGTTGIGVSLVSDRFGNNDKAYYFNGVGNISLIAIPTSDSQDFTITAWIKTNNTSVRKGIACWGQDNPWQSTYFFITNNGYLNFGFAYNGGPQSPSFIADDQWHFVGISCTSGLINLYLDGITTGSPLQMYPNINGANKALGANIDNSGSNNFVGSLDDITIYNRALTQEEITSLYAGTVPCAATSSDTNLTIPNTALPYTWNGLTFNAAGTQTAHLTNDCGADSAATLNLTVTNTLPSYLPTNGLVGWWPFNGNANDESGNGNIGTVNGATLTSDRFGNIGKAYDFNGFNNSIDVSTLNTIQYKPITYAAWIKADSLVVTYHQLGGGIVILGREKSGTGNQGAFMIYSYPPGNVSNQLFYYTGTTGTYGNYNPIVNNWTHVAMTIESNDSISFYVNGTLTQRSYFQFASSANIPFRIGSGTDVAVGSDRFNFNGKLDDIAIYNRALTQEEITQLYTSCSAPSSSEFSAAGCEQYQLPWGENPVTTSGDYLHTYQTTEGCDSTVTAHITINHAVAGASFNASGINTYTLPWGDTAIQSGYYTHLYQNEYGCDSLVTAYVVINSPADSSSHNIGINVDNPQRNLHIKDAIRLEPRNTPLNNPTKGDIYFDSSLNKLRVYDGTTWQNCW